MDYIPKALPERYRERSRFRGWTVAVSPLMEYRLLRPWHDKALWAGNDEDGTPWIAALTAAALEAFADGRSLMATMDLRDDLTAALIRRATE